MSPARSSLLSDDDLSPEAGGLLPIQHVGRAMAPASPEAQLMTAVLAEALVDFRRYAGNDRPKARTLFNRARNWIASPDRSWPYSFENICGALELDPDRLRRSLALQREARCGGALLHRAGLRRVKRLPEPAGARDAAAASEPSDAPAEALPRRAKAPG